VSSEWAYLIGLSRYGAISATVQSLASLAHIYLCPEFTLRLVRRTRSFHYFLATFGRHGQNQARPPFIPPTGRLRRPHRRNIRKNALGRRGILQSEPIVHTTLTPNEQAKFRELNGKYKARFQFPFILAVRNASKYTVLSALEGRVDSSIEEEISCALFQVDKIAWMRLLTLVDCAEGSNGHGGFLTCHVLDTANGCPASGMRIDLYQYDDGPEKQRILLESFITNSDGRLSKGPALSGTAFRHGQYEWIFYVGDYFAKFSSSRISGTPFLDVIPLRFGLDDPTEHYHVPLLVSPWSYSTYRGS